MTADKTDNDQKHIVYRLTALWALNESGLGGWMFALKIPFTGFFVGGFAVVLIGLIAYYSRRQYRQVAEATILVMLVKAAVSPHAPLPAYIAVAFQGFTGALLFRHIRNFRWAAVWLGTLAMAESALQKLLMMTLVFGKSLWQALDDFFHAIAKDVSLPAHMSFSMVVICLYTGIYIIWGLLLGLWTGKLPLHIERHAAEITAQYHLLPPSATTIPAGSKKNRKYLLYIILLLLIIIVTRMDSHAEGWQKTAYVLLRTVTAILLLFGIVQPLGKWLIQRWLQRQKSERHAVARQITDSLPAIRGYVRPAWQIAGLSHKGLGRLKAFVFNLVVLTMYVHE